MFGLYDPDSSLSPVTSRQPPTGLCLFPLYRIAHGVLPRFSTTGILHLERAQLQIIHSTRIYPREQSLAPGIRCMGHRCAGTSTLKHDTLAGSPRNQSPNLCEEFRRIPTRVAELCCRYEHPFVLSTTSLISTATSCHDYTALIPSPVCAPILPTFMQKSCRR